MSKEKSNMEIWAEREIQIACERERNGAPENEWDYGVACYESALKAYKSLLEDEHSGASFGITMSILNALAKGQPLTPIEDTDDIWNECGRYLYEKDYITYQCKRMSSLFKKIYDDGTIKYTDVNRFICVNKHNPKVKYRSGLVDRIVGEIFPITMPYIPKQYTVVCDECLTDRENGDFDTKAILFVHDDNGLKQDIYRYFKEGEKDFEEIDIKEYQCRLDQSNLRTRLEELEDLGYDVTMEEKDENLVVTVQKCGTKYFASIPLHYVEEGLLDRAGTILKHIDHCVRYVDKDFNIKEVSE